MKLLIDTGILLDLKSREKIPLECEKCNNTYYRIKSDVMRALRGTKKIRFCSRFCTNLNIVETKNIKINCDFCSKEVLKVLSEIGNHNFCSSACSAKFNNKKRGASTYRQHPCLTCCKIIVHSNKKHCSSMCYQQYRFKKYIQMWLNGEVDGSSKTGCSNTIRTYLFIKHNHACSKCGWREINPITGKCPLEVDHIDGNFKNNTEDNLRLLCPNCHSLTPTYKALNKGRGRKYRN